MTEATDTATAPDFMTVYEVAAVLRLKRDSVHNMARRGRIASYQIGHRRLFKRADVDALIDSRRRESGSMLDRSLEPLTGKRRDGRP